MADTFGIPSASLQKIQRMLNAKRAAGITVQPWELEAAFDAEMNVAAGRQAQNRQIGIQEASQAEQARVNRANEALKEQEIKAGKTSSIAQGASSLAMLGLMGKQAGLWGNKAVPGGVTNVTATPKPTISNWFPGNTTQSSSITTESYPQTPGYSQVDATGKLIKSPISDTGEAVGSAVTAGGETAGAGGGILAGQTETGYAGVAAAEDAAAGIGAGAAEASPMAGAGAVAWPAAIVTGALMAKNQWGGKDIPWDEKTYVQKSTTAPGSFLGAGGVLTNLAGADTVVGKVGKEIARGEQIVMKPIEGLLGFLGDLF